MASCERKANESRFFLRNCNGTYMYLLLDVSSFACYSIVCFHCFSYNRRTEMYLKEHGHIQGSDAMTEEAIRYYIVILDGCFLVCITRLLIVTIGLQ